MKKMTLTMDDFALWETWLEAQKHADELKSEIERRGLTQKPLVEWSIRPTQRAADGFAAGNAEDVDESGWLANNVTHETRRR